MTDLADIAWQRLRNEHLVGEPLTSPEAVVGWLGAVQSQDYPGARWAVGQRSLNSSDQDVHDAFQKGKILRTHVMRPTWHFVLPADIRWLLELTAPRVHAVSAYYYRKLELNDATFSRCHEVLAKALKGGKELTRPELAKELAAAGINASGLRMGYIVMHAELEGLICNGAMRGKQHTYALLDERVPKAKKLSRDEALAELAKRYFTSHGPAQLHDFAWWSGLTLADVKKGVELAGKHLAHETVGGKDYWFGPLKILSKPAEPVIHLLPNYDEALIAYKDRSALVDPTAGIVDVELLINHVIVRDGRVIGGWRRITGKNEVTVETRLPNILSKAEQRALAAAVKRFEHFLGTNVRLT